MTDRLIIGTMSGTSADGVDAALVRIGGRGLDMTAELIGHCHRRYEPKLRQTIFDMRSTGHAEFAALASLGREITLIYANAVRDVLFATDTSANQVTAIAAHGQTLYHNPPMTIQWFDPSLLAWETGCPVVSDFRRADCAAGGQGAPLVPFADYILFRHPTKDRILLNLGGIANFTWVGAGTGPDRILGFDVGPGNCISDALMRRHDAGNDGFDRGGQLAMKGTVIPEILRATQRDPFLSEHARTSTDGPAMLALWDRAVAASGIIGARLEDLLATAAELSSQCFLLAIHNSVVAFPDEIIVSGGGVENQAIMSRIRQGCGSIPVRRIEELGFPTSAKEAVAFALLGAATLDGIPSNVPSVTGAKRAVVLGSVTPRP